ncbi:hypothetical protein COL95_29525, partial [Bacillus anthracis]
MKNDELFWIKRRLEPDVWKRTSPVLRGERVREDSDLPDFIEIPKLLQQWREEKINPWENEFARWLLLLPAHEDEHLTHTLEDIAMKASPYMPINL